MGRHRSTLRELGWGASNSPNPWKQGSAKRVVRTLDYSAAELDDDENTVLPSSMPQPAAEQQPQQQQQQQPGAGGAAVLDEKLAQLQQDGRQQLDRIREQFEAQEAESKRKLDRLNGRIAELGEGKRSMWSAFQGATKPAGGKEGEAASQGGATAEAGQQQGAAVAGDAGAAALARREAELSQRAVALDKAEADAKAKADAAALAQQAVAAREAAVAVREADAKAKELSLAELEAKLARAREQLDSREQSVRKAEASVAARESALAAKADASAASSKQQQQQQQQANEAPVEAAASSAAAKEEEAKKAAKEEEARSKVRFEKAAAAKAAEEAAKAKAGGASSKPVKEADVREIQCDCNAEWARSENLTSALMKQRSENPDEVFYPLPHQRTCELSDIFSAPRKRERGKGSGEWTPVLEEETNSATRALFGAGASSKPPAASERPPNALQLLGVEGEYMGELLPIALLFGASAPAKTILLGRSSSCDVTLSRDDQISRKHMQMESKDGKLIARDLGSTYGTRLNGKALVPNEATEFKPGDVLVLGASSFMLRSVGGK